MATSKTKILVCWSRDRPFIHRGRVAHRHKVQAGTHSPEVATSRGTFLDFPMYFWYIV